MHRIIQLEYSIGTCSTKIYMMQGKKLNKNNCTAVRRFICRVQIVINRTQCETAQKHWAKKKQQQTKQKQIKNIISHQWNNFDLKSIYTGLHFYFWTNFLRTSDHIGCFTFTNSGLGLWSHHSPTKHTPRTPRKKSTNHDCNHQI